MTPSRLPHPEEVSIADAIAFDNFTPEQKRVAIAGVAIHEWLQKRVEEEIEAAAANEFERGFAVCAEQNNATLHDALDRLQLLRQKISTADTRYTELGEIIADLSKSVTP